ncbi:carboxyl-terminal-processing peptidase 1, chloroplastic-like isoform X3 [Phragmites australis]|uniref:carboxyl-terminal-processing peptidase 1, chloroplastic-like isoform X3 n=1 Tax=Phragmites australis TaxID=29695 RepID=UPI002D76EAEA|nr:carboxyl-terminal-processing peptidase 1, chloroplastic-like isoform X3 [Phragmites australis]
MRPLSYAPPAPQSRASPSPGRGLRTQPCALPFPDALRAAAAAAAVSLSLLAGDAACAAVAAAPQPPEMCRDGGAAMEEEVRAEAVTNEQLVEEAWEVVNESFLPDAGSRPWSPEMWMQRKQDILQGTIKSRSKAHDIIRKMLASLGDPYTRFLSPSEGDELLSVNGIDVRGKSAFDASSMLQGPKETFVTIKVKHSDCGPVESMKVQRQLVARTPVFYRLEKRENEDSSVGYIHIKEFNAVAKKDLVSALKRLQNSGASYFVLDLRDNLGGLVQAGIETAKLFLNKGDTVIYTAGRDRQVQNTIVAESGPLVATPLMLLVNNRTASASEIVASALHDNCKAVLVGERTFGKGLIQSVFELHDGSGIVVTVGKYVTPNHKDINGNGIEPDYNRLPDLKEARDYLSRCQSKELS